MAVRRATISRDQYKNFITTRHGGALKQQLQLPADDELFLVGVRVELADTRVVARRAIREPHGVNRQLGRVAAHVVVEARRDLVELVFITLPLVELDER